METVHEFDLSASRCPIFGGPRSVELPRAHLTRLFMRQSEHFTKLPAGRKKKGHGAASRLASLAALGRFEMLKEHLHAQFLVHIVVVGHPAFAVDGYWVVGCELILLLQCPCTQR